MAMEILLKRPHTEVPWGFRIIGGSDSHLPIIVSKVLENSIAERSGLEEDVSIERINNIPTSGLTHGEVNQIILGADTEILFHVRRENLEEVILASLNESENNSEISSILRQAVTKTHKVEGTLCAEPSEGIGLQREFGIIMTVDTNNNLRPESKSIENFERKNMYLNSNQLSKKKWSTFLQKPKNPLPQGRNQLQQVPKADRYKVIIKKQPKKITSEQAVEQILQASSECEKTIENSVIEREKFETDVLELDEEIQTNISEEIETEQKELEDLRSTEIGSYTIMETQEVSEEVSQQEDEILDHILNVENEENKIKIIVKQPSLEEQLAAVQRQLQELAKFPSEIQETLTVVTQQLASIVEEQKQEACENSTQEDDIEEGKESDMDDSVKMRYPEEEYIESDEVSDEVADFKLDEVGEYLESKDPLPEVLSDICEEEEIIEAEDTEQIEEDAEQIGIREEKVLKQKLQEQEELAEKSKMRPIVLPGGRKWVDPDDAVMKVKAIKMSDEKICNTIETFSEVIVGKTKGINFLKYTPPSKNLDYLQRSEVYRLVHGMEPPVKGISLRSEKILAEQDYYTAGGN